MLVWLAEYLSQFYSPFSAVKYLTLRGIFSVITALTICWMLGPRMIALLNSLQMGFKTLAIQKRSSEVWNVLAAVKKEFNTFGGVLEKAQKKLNEANNEIENLVGTRTRIMQSKLKTVEQLELPSKPKEETNLLDFKD